MSDIVRCECGVKVLGKGGDICRECHNKKYPILDLPFVSDEPVMSEEEPETVDAPEELTAEADQAPEQPQEEDQDRPEPEPEGLSPAKDEQADGGAPKVKKKKPKV